MNAALIDSLRNFWTDSAAWVRALVRGSELWLFVLATGVGIFGGAIVALMSGCAFLLHSLLFGIDLEARLSSMPVFDTPLRAIVPALGGVVLAIIALLLARRGRRPAIDPIEANALHGGRMSMIDSMVVAVQTLISNGFGASVGLEAGYTQAVSALASKFGQAFRLRRADMRLMVGCGAAAAISAAFDAPLAGAFYAFELIIGTYSVSMVAPVMAAAIAASLTQRAIGIPVVPIEIGAVSVTTADYGVFIVTGLLCGLAGIAIMRAVTWIEVLFRASRLPAMLRPLVGGLMIGGLALITPQVLSSGHGALHLNLTINPGLEVFAMVLALKALASAISLGSGFRGGLFFASLFMGGLFGRVLADLLALAAPTLAVDPVIMAVVAMAALAVAIVGGPATMTFLALESTGDFLITGIVLSAAIVSSLTVRELFGYSFSTWRMHLRGETVRSAHDVGWIRSLTVGRMMQTGLRTVRTDMTLAELRGQFPLGSTPVLVAVDEADHYAGLIVVSEAHVPTSDPEMKGRRRVRDILHHTKDTLLPAMNVKQAIQTFDETESEALAVVESPTSLNVVGLLTESHALRRYSDELDKARRSLSGED